ncbi:MAG: hypothetical protein ACO1O3_06060 [Sphingobium sp.]
MCRPGCRRWRARPCRSRSARARRHRPICGGTLGGTLSRRDMDVIDIGAPVMSIHNSHDLSSKVDLWSLYNANKAFFAAP